jgi:hypothetical protein
MDFKSTIDLIIRDLNEASEIIDDLKKYPGVPLLQVELAKSKCRSAGDVIALLKTLSLTDPSEGEHAGKHPVNLKDEPVIPQQSVKSIFTQEEKKGPASKVPPVLEQKTEMKSQENKSAETHIIADKFTPTADLYEEQLSSLKAERDISDRLKAKTLATLTDAIGISDKFLFIGEIFDGDKEAYSQAISRLDKTESLDDAKAIIMSYASEKTDKEAIRQLIDLVKLKLSSNE